MRRGEEKRTRGGGGCEEDSDGIGAERGKDEVGMRR